MNFLIRLAVTVLVVFVAFWLISLLPIPYPIPLILKVIVVLYALYDIYGTVNHNGITL